MILPFLFTFSVFTSLSSASSVNDYCVADLSQPNGPAGYACKDPKKVTVDEFVHSVFAVPGSSNTTIANNAGANTYYTAQFSGLNSMGLSMVQKSLDVGEILPIHTHRVSEIIFVVGGMIESGFIDTNNTPYYKTLHKGDMMIHPPSLVHFHYNAGSKPAVLYSILAGENPGTQFILSGLFGNSMPSKLVEKITMLDHAVGVYNSIVLLQRMSLSHIESLTKYSPIYKGEYTTKC